MNAEEANDDTLVKLAKKQGMNTDIRRSIFVVLMSSDVRADIFLFNNIAVDRQAELGLRRCLRQTIAVESDRGPTTRDR